jgi:hypothetical protein
MTTPTQPPCRQGLRCPNPETCDHIFPHPDGSENRLHPDDWFEPTSSEYASEAEYEEAAEAYKAVQARALWACKLDCPMRLECLQVGMQPGPTLAYGIYGGYTSEQRRQIVREKEARRTSR